jgi:hypothetical protein
MTLADAVGTLGQERSYAESEAGILKHFAPDDIDGHILYAKAKAAFDGLLDALLADLSQHQDPALSPVFRIKLDASITQRVAFTRYVDNIVRAQVPSSAKPAFIGAIAAALAKIPADLVKELFDGGIAIWREFRTAGKDRRDEIKARLEAERWKPFADIAPAS